MQPPPRGGVAFSLSFELVALNLPDRMGLHSLCLAEERKSQNFLLSRRGQHLSPHGGSPSHLTCRSLPSAHPHPVVRPVTPDPQFAISASRRLLAKQVARAVSRWQGMPEVNNVRVFRFRTEPPRRSEASPALPHRQTCSRASPAFLPRPAPKAMSVPTHQFCAYSSSVDNASLTLSVNP